MACRPTRQKGSNSTLKKIQSQGVARPASISTLRIFRACGDFWNGIERPQNGTGKPGGSAESDCRTWAGRGFKAPSSISGECRDGSTMIVRSIAGGVEVLAPAKLNLFLEVLGRRPDGYHEIESLMVAVDLYDTLTFTDDSSGAIILRVRRPDACRPGARTWWSRRPSVSRPRRAVRAGRAIELHEGDPGAGGAGGRLERRGGDAGGPGPALGPADARRPAGRAGRGDRQRRGVLPARTGGGLSRPGRAGGGRALWASPCTSCWSVRRVGLSTADVYRKSDTARTAPADRTGPGGAGSRWTGRPGSKPVQPASTRRRDASARAGRGSATPWRAWARRSTGP